MAAVRTVPRFAAGRVCVELREGPLGGSPAAVAIEARFGQLYGVGQAVRIA